MPVVRNSPIATNIRRYGGFVAAVVAVGMGWNGACAQTTFGAGTEVVLPLAAHVFLYHTQVFVRNPNPVPITVNVRYYQSLNGTPPAGLRTCTPLALLANQSSLEELVTFARAHFAAEEALMDQYGIADRVTHKQSHRRLLQDAMSLANMPCGASITLTAGFMHEWLIRHIDSADRELARQLLAKGYSEGNSSNWAAPLTPPDVQPAARG